MENKFIILQGLPASGKSTWSKLFVKNKKDWVIINRDSLRNMRGDYWIPDQENLISKWEEFCIKSAIKENLNIIIDATNLNPKTLKKWTDLCSLYGLEPEFKFFRISVEECIKRDSKRENPVGEAVIMRMYNSYIKDTE